MLQMIYIVYVYHYANFTWLSCHWICCLAKEFIFIVPKHVKIIISLGGIWRGSSSWWQLVVIMDYSVHTVKSHTSFYVKLSFVVFMTLSPARISRHSFYSLNNSSPWCGYEFYSPYILLSKNLKIYS